MILSFGPDWNCKPKSPSSLRESGQECGVLTHPPIPTPSQGEVSSVLVKLSSAENSERAEAKGRPGESGPQR